MKKLRKIVAADEDVKKSLKLSSLKNNIERIQGYLRLDDSLEVTPKEYFIDIDDSGAIGVYAQYDVGFELELNKDTDGKVRLLSTSKVDLESKEIKDVATWLFNLNIEGAEKVYGAAQEIVDEYDLKGIDDLIEYVNKKDVKSSTSLRRRGVTAGCHGRKSVTSGSSLGDNGPSVKQIWDFLIESGWAYDACELFGIEDHEDEAAMRAIPKSELMMWIYSDDELYNNFVEYFDIEED